MEVTDVVAKHNVSIFCVLHHEVYQILECLLVEYFFVGAILINKLMKVGCYVVPLLSEF